MLWGLFLLMESALKRAEESSMSAWEIRAWEEFYWKCKLTLGMWGSRAWEANPWHGGGAGSFPVCQRATKEHKDESAPAEGQSDRDFCEVPSSFVKALCRLEFKPSFWAGSTSCPLCGLKEREFRTSYLTFLFGYSLRLIFLEWGRRNVHIEFPGWILAWDSCVPTRMTIQVPYLAIFCEDYRKREPVETSLSPGREDSWRWSQKLFWILQVLLHILQSHVTPWPCSALSLCLLDTANDSDSTSSVSRLFLWHPVDGATK